MKFTKSFYIAPVVALALVGCGAPKGIVSVDPSKIDMMPLKTTKLAEKDMQRWSHLDLVKDTVPGMSVDKAYEFLKGKKANKITVAVVDSGIDIEHEDLKANVWVNPKEIAGNKKDDDNNGYVDDIHGWNFLGDADNEQLEMTRIVKKGNDGSVQYENALAQLTAKKAELEPAKQQLDMILNADKAVSDHLKKTNYTLAEVKAIKTTDQSLAQSAAIMTQILTNTGTKEKFEAEMQEYKDYVYDNLNYNLNTEFDGRKVVGDNPNDITNTKYGNSNVIGPKKSSAKHGTHVAGIIAQVRNNKKGGDGIASDVVKIMSCRAVPNGDEYDKDIALAIRYAVDNGAKVINGSFGKSFSPNRQWVYDAIKYAASKDVLFVHAAGNDGQDIDKAPNFPNDAEGTGAEFADNVLTIGALNYEYGANVMANFSNYGKVNVDIFAPGVKIYATTPSNTYEYLQGTSMASPNVAGVAALIRAYYPSLTAAQVKQIIMESGTPLKNTFTLAGESGGSTTMDAISRTGKIVNAYNALVLAEQRAKK